MDTKKITKSRFYDFSIIGLLSLYEKMAFDSVEITICLREKRCLNKYDVFAGVAQMKWNARRKPVRGCLKVPMINETEAAISRRKHNCILRRKRNNRALAVVNREPQVVIRPCDKFRRHECQRVAFLCDAVTGGQRDGARL